MVLVWCTIKLDPFALVHTVAYSYHVDFSDLGIVIGLRSEIYGVLF